jgi:hypothetical protein
VSSRAGRLAYKPVGMALGALAGLAAGVIFKQIWKQIEGDRGVPHPTDEDRDWGEILGAAVLQGAIFALVKAAVDRAGAAGVRRVTGHWPG